LKTHVYIDGYNLYYGRLRTTPYKWLDVGALARRIVRAQNPASAVTCTRYFTAPALEKYARRGTSSVDAQSAYHRALDWVNMGIADDTKHRKVSYVPGELPPRFQIVYGKHSLHANVSRPSYDEGVKWPSKANQVKVWEIVEKETDVNIALTMYRDVAKGFADQVVLFSNDSDALPVLRALREDFPKVVVGVVAPIEAGQSHASEQLRKAATWHRSSIDVSDLVACQLPPVVHRQGGEGKKGKPAISKPAHWGPEGS
jgi:uncharacterized LabA/DUF88 family protein